MSTNQLNDLRSYSRHWLGEFIELYQAEECLWQPKHPDYSNHSVRNKAYDKLVEKLKEVEPHPDRAMVVRKINSLRSAFRREFRKTSSKSNYETRLWYYDKLLFIADQNSKRLSMDCKPPKRELGLGFDEDDTMDFETEDPLETTGGSQQGGSDGQPESAGGGGGGTVTVSTSGNCVTLVKSENQLSHHHQQQIQEQAQHQQQQQQQATQIHLQQHAHHAGASQPQHTTAVKVLEITSLDSNSQREIQQAVSSLEHQHQMQQQLHQHQSGQTTATAQLAQLQHHQVQLQPLFGNSTFSTTSAPSATHRNDDEYDAIGVNVASKLRVMNPTQRIIAEKLISDVLFNAQLNTLSISSTLTQ